MLHISENIHHMIFIYGTLVQNDNISSCFFHFIKIVILRAVRSVKGQKWSKVRKSSVGHTPYLRNHTSYDFHLCIYGKNDDISRISFPFYQNFDFTCFQGGQKGKR